MEAIVQDGYGSPGDVLVLRTIDKPAVGDDEVLVRVRAASVHPDVWHVVRGRPYVLRLMGAGLLKPKNSVPGTDVAGRVESVGENVTRFRPGDEVFGESIRGLQWNNGGAYAEYASVPEEALALKPANVPFEQAAAVPTSGLIVLQNLADEVRPDLRHPWQPPVLGLSARPRPRRQVRAHRTRPLRTGGRPLAGKRSPRPQTGGALPVREPVAGSELLEAGQDDPDGALEGAARGRKDHARHR